MWPRIAPSDGMALDMPASAFPSALFSPEERDFQEIAPAQWNHSPDTQARHLLSFQECDGRRCCSPSPCVPLTLGENLLQFLGTSHSYQQTHGTSQSLQPAGCLQRAERPQLISHLPQGQAHTQAAPAERLLCWDPHTQLRPLLAASCCGSSALAPVPPCRWVETPHEACCVSHPHPSQRFPIRYRQRSWRATEKRDLFKYSDLGGDGTKKLKLR